MKAQIFAYVNLRASNVECPSIKAVDLVSPVMACLDSVYGAECGRGVCAEMEPLLMMRPS